MGTALKNQKLIFPKRLSDFSLSRPTSIWQLVAMARRTRLNYKGAIHHVYFRGNAREPIFMDDGDRRRCLRNLEQRVESYQIRLYQYCLMSNHVHLLLETPLGNLSQFMGSFLTSYAVFFNLKHGRSGHLTQGRYHSPLVEGNEHLLRLSRYIHLNPVFTGQWKDRPAEERLKHLRQYRWSSYPSYVGLSSPQNYVDYGPILNLVGQGDRNPVETYRIYVETGITQEDVEFREMMRSSSLGIGSERFLLSIKKRYEGLTGTRVQAEDVAFRRPRKRVPPERIMEEVCSFFHVELDQLRVHKKRDWMKPIAAALLTKLGGLTQRESAFWLGVSTGAAVNEQLKRLKEKSPPSVLRLLGKLEEKFDN